MHPLPLLVQRLAVSMRKWLLQLLYVLQPKLDYMRVLQVALLPLGLDGPSVLCITPDSIVQVCCA